MNPPSVSIRYFKMGSPIKLAKLPEDLQIEENYKKKKKGFVKCFVQGMLSQKSLETLSISLSPLQLCWIVWLGTPDNINGKTTANWPYTLKEFFF